ncbi:MAG: hypothetical protein R6U38_15155 [Desulfatiglandaceae bacterium]
MSLCLPLNLEPGTQGFYGPVPDWIQRKVRTILPPDLLDIIDRFYAGFMNP